MSVVHVTCDAKLRIQVAMSEMKPGVPWEVPREVPPADGVARALAIWLIRVPK
jgi:hypothetical protein